MDEKFAISHGLKPCLLEHAYEPEVFDGRPAHSRAVTHMVIADMLIDQHRKSRSPIFSYQLSALPNIMGIPWLRKYDVNI